MKRKNPLAETPHKTQHIYQPPDWAWRYLAAYLDTDVKQSVSARCAEAGIERSTYYDARKNPSFVVWLNDQLSSAISEDGHEVRTALLRKCLTGDIEAVRLWHELYEKYVPAHREILEGDLSKLSRDQLFALTRGLAEGTEEGTGPAVH